MVALRSPATPADLSSGRDRVPAPGRRSSFPGRNPEQVFMPGQGNQFVRRHQPTAGSAMPSPQWPTAPDHVPDRVIAPADASRIPVHPADRPVPSLSRAEPSMLQRCGGAACPPRGYSYDDEALVRRQAVSPVPGPAQAGVPPAVREVVRSSGRELPLTVRQLMEPRFGHDFGDVRVHTDAVAARTARAVDARAYTVGRNVIFGDGQFRPDSPAGQRLIAHELTHVIQQRVGGGPPAALPRTVSSPSDAAEREADRVADAVSTVPGIASTGLATPPITDGAAWNTELQRQVTGARESEDMWDPRCPRDRPYYWGPKKGPYDAEPAVNAQQWCMKIPLPRGRENPIRPGPPPPEPAPEPVPPPEPVHTPEPGPGSVAGDHGPARQDSGSDFEDDPLRTLIKPVEPPSPFEDDPMSAAGFGPEDQSIMVRPGPVRSTLIRPGPGPDLSCSYEMRQIAEFNHAAEPLDLTELAKDVKKALTGCDIAFVYIEVAPTADDDDDPNQHAIDRAESIKQRLMQATGIPSADRFDTGLTSGGQGEPEVHVWLGGRQKQIPGSSSVPPAKQPEGGKGQVSFQAGVGSVEHSYMAPAGPNDALHEWLMQVAVAYTKQLHKKDKSGEERQYFAQVQYSLTSREWTVNFGYQESWVIPLPGRLQLSFWAQVMGMPVVSSGTGQGSLSAGTQLTWQPLDWLTFGAQYGLGPTIQSSGQNSVDRSGQILFQIGP